MTAPEEQQQPHVGDSSDSGLLQEEIKRRAHSRMIVDVEEETVKVVIFRSSEQHYAFYGRIIREILPPLEISWVPGLPEFLPGLINIRGDIESTVDIHSFLGDGNHDRSRCMIALAVTDRFRSGILIDEIEDVTDIPADSIQPPLATLNSVARELVCGEFDYHGVMVSLLDIELLADKITL